MVHTICTSNGHKEQQWYQRRATHVACRLFLLTKRWGLGPSPSSAHHAVRLAWSSIVREKGLSFPNCHWSTMWVSSSFFQMLAVYALWSGFKGLSLPSLFSDEHLLNKYLLSSYCVGGTGFSLMNRQTHFLPSWSLWSSEAYSVFLHDNWRAFFWRRLSWSQLLFSETWDGGTCCGSTSRDWETMTTTHNTQAS